jgi:hypothetical protein
VQRSFDETLAGLGLDQPAHLDRIIAETGITPAVNQAELHRSSPTTPSAPRRRATASR